MTDPNCQSFENSSVSQGDPAPAVSSAPAQRKKPHIAVRVLMQLLSFCLFIVLLVSYTTDRVFVYALLRCVQTIAGVFIAWLLNVKIFPYHGKQ